MMGTAVSSLCPRSSAACPPRLKMPTLYPGLAQVARGHQAGRGTRGAVACCVAAETPCATTAGIATLPSTAAPLTWRKVRRLLEVDSEDGRLVIEPSEAKSRTLPQTTPFYSLGRSRPGAVLRILFRTDFAVGEVSRTKNRPRKTRGRRGACKPACLPFCDL